MKKLFIIRHAKAEFNSNIDDHDRCLTDKGVKDCSKVAKFLKTKNIFPDHIICSSSIRTTHTIRNILQECNLSNTVIIKPEIYRASSREIINIVSEIDNSFKKVMIVAHNPAVHELCEKFAKDGLKSDLTMIKAGMVPAAIALFCFDTLDNWQSISEYQNPKLEWFYNP
jgi:phosphohistidine phosphatase